MKCGDIFDVSAPEDFVRKLYGDEFDATFSCLLCGTYHSNVCPLKTELRLKQEVIPELYAAVMHEAEEESCGECGYRHDPATR